MELKVGGGGGNSEIEKKEYLKIGVRKTYLRVEEDFWTKETFIANIY